MAGEISSATLSYRVNENVFEIFDCRRNLLSAENYEHAMITKFRASIH